MSRVDCEKAMAHLQDYLKHEITPEIAAEVKLHLEHCRPCFRHARFEANFLAMLESRGCRETCPGELRRRIVKMLRMEARTD
jgi:anti-sigma factor (TIGR02949 family)